MVQDNPEEVVPSFGDTWSGFPRLGSLLMFLQLLLCSNNVFVCCFPFFKKIISSRPRRKWTCVGLFALCTSIINKKSFWSRLCFYFVIFSGKNGNTKNLKSIIISKCLHTIIHFLKSNIYADWTLIIPLNILTLYSLPTLSSMCPKLKERRMKRFPMRSLAHWGILAIEAANKNIKKIAQKMTFTYKDWHGMLPFALHEYCTSVHTSTGATPFSLVYNLEVVLPVEVEVPSMRVLMKAKLDWT